MRLPGPASPAWVAAETLAAAVFALFGLLFIARLIGPAAAGTGAIAASAFLLVDIPLSALFGDALLQRRQLEARHRAAAMAATLLLALLAAAGLALAAPLLAAATGLPDLAALVRALAPLLPVSAMSGLLAALALRAQRYRLLAARVLLGQPVALLAGVLAALAGWGAWAMVVAQATATLSVGVLLLRTAGGWPRPRLDRAALAELWPVAAPQVLSVMVFAGRYRLFLLVLGVIASELVVAVTHIAFRLLDVALAAVNGAASRLAMPRLAALQHDRAALAEAYGDLAQLQAMAGLPVALGLAIAAPQLIALLMGPAWAEAAAPARLVALAAIPAFLVGPAPALWLALGRTRVNLALQLLAFAVPLLALLATRPAGPAGAALAWAAGSLAVPPVQAVLTLGVLGRSPLWLLRRLAVPLLASAAMAGVALAIAQAIAPAGVGVAPLPGLLLVAGSGAAAYLGVLALALGGRWPAALRPA